MVVKFVVCLLWCFRLLFVGLWAGVVFVILFVWLLDFWVFVLGYIWFYWFCFVVCLCLFTFSLTILFDFACVWWLVFTPWFELCLADYWGWYNPGFRVFSLYIWFVMFLFDLRWVDSFVLIWFNLLFCFGFVHCFGFSLLLCWFYLLGFVNLDFGVFVFGFEYGVFCYLDLNAFCLLLGTGVSVYDLMAFSFEFAGV